MIIGKLHEGGSKCGRDVNLISGMDGVGEHLVIITWISLCLENTTEGYGRNNKWDYTETVSMHDFGILILDAQLWYILRLLF